MDESALIPTEPVTVVLSERGWVRAGKGHELDPKELSYKAGDAFLMAARGRSNQNAVFLDSTGRTYSLPAHGLPSARGQGEPLSSHLTPPPGASFVGVLMGSDDDLYLLATTRRLRLHRQAGRPPGRNRAGKAVITVPPGAKVLPPAPGRRTRTTERLAAATDGGRLLVFPLKEMPLLPRGKGVKIVNLPAKGGESLLALRRLLAGSPPDRPLRQALPQPEALRDRGIRGHPGPPRQQASPGIPERDGAGGDLRRVPLLSGRAPGDSKTPRIFAAQIGDGRYYRKGLSAIIGLCLLRRGYPAVTLQVPMDPGPLCRTLSRLL